MKALIEAALELVDNRGEDYLHPDDRKMLEEALKDYRKWPIDERVGKKSGSEWTGNIVGYYSTELTPFGIAVESEKHSGSVQIYPTKAMEKL